jgi:hypothetical protein
LGRADQQGVDIADWGIAGASLGRADQQGVDIADWGIDAAVGVKIQKPTDFSATVPCTPTLGASMVTTYSAPGMSRLVPRKLQPEPFHSPETPSSSFLMTAPPVAGTWKLKREPLANDPEIPTDSGPER